jgi:hypothetical protein
MSAKLLALILAPEKSTPILPGWSITPTAMKWNSVQLDVAAIWERCLDSNVLYILLNA